MSDTRPMTYAELADALGRTEIAARSLAARKRWRLVPGNDGKDRLAVPVELLDRLRARSIDRPTNASETLSIAASMSPSDGASTDRAFAMFEARIAELQNEVK